MSLDFLREPVSEDAPCGEDLMETMDPEFDEYYFDAVARLPEPYFRLGQTTPDGGRTPDTVFDPKSVDARAEEKTIDAMLGRSRDIRLLVLRAQIEALTGRLGQVAASIGGIADLLEVFGDSVHPTMGSGVADRRDALGDLAQQHAMLQPLQFADLTGSGEVSYRKMRVAQGETAPLLEEEDVALGPMLDALGSSANRKRVDESHAALMQIDEALGRIVSLCKSHPERGFVPQLDPLRTLVQAILTLIGQARSDLRSLQDIAAAEEGVATAEAPEAETATPAAASAAPAAAPVALPPGAITSHAQARLWLEGCEGYYRRYEPSSAALPLVTQARLLIGKPLIEALETLLPDHATRAQVEFGPKTGFLLQIDRLRSLTYENGDIEEPELPDDCPGIPAFEDPQATAQGLQTVEDYFRRVERSSPIPILLHRARSYLNKDFQALIDELIPNED